MKFDSYLILALLAMGLGLLMRFTVIRFSKADKPVSRLWLALAMLSLIFAAHVEVLYVILDVTGMMAAFGPATAASIFAALLGGFVIVLCHLSRKKRKLSEDQKLELSAM